MLLDGLFLLLFLLPGVVFLSGKGSFLIAGYNTASQKEKERIDEKTLCRCVGKMMFAFAGCFLILIISSLLDKIWLLWLGPGLFFGVAAGGVIYLNTGDRLKK